MKTAKMLIRLVDAQGDLNLRWTHMSEVTLSDVATIWLCYKTNTETLYKMLMNSTDNHLHHCNLYSISSIS